MSRGLGDVYKRQPIIPICQSACGANNSDNETVASKVLTVAKIFPIGIRRNAKTNNFNVFFSILN